MKLSEPSKLNLDRFDIALNNVRRIFDWIINLISIWIVVYAIYQSTQVQTMSERNALLFGGLLGGGFVFLTSWVIDFGFHIQDKMFNWTEVQFTKYTNIRRWILAPIAASFATFTPILVLVYGEFNSFWKVFLFIILGFIFPAALTSIIREQKRRENTFLINYRINSALIVENPQAAIEHAFTVLEDRLRQRIKVGAEHYGEKLVNTAFGKNGKLVFSEIEAENIGMRNLLSGAYATFRNPRKHRIVEDDEKTVLSILSLVELLITLVDESKDNETETS